MRTSEFVALTALITSITALAIDTILPALPFMGADLGVTDPNMLQFIIGAQFLGFAMMQIIYGPVSDSIGRKPTIVIGLGIFLIGTMIAGLATSFEVHLTGRFIQGVGCAGLRAVSTAIIRDKYEGPEMARITSIIMAIFIIVPVLAPAAGQVVLKLSSWRGIFVGFGVLASIAVAWFMIRQEETLRAEYKRPFSMRRSGVAFLEVLHHRQSVGLMFASGIMFGAFLVFLITSQQTFADIYNITEMFPYYFSLAALSMGISSLLNAKLVKHFDLIRLIRIGLACQIALSVAFVSWDQLNTGHASLWLFMGWLIFTLFCMGPMLSNFQALIMQPLGHLAGTAASVVGTIMALLSLSVGSIIAQTYNQSLLPLTGGFAVLGLIALGIVHFSVKRKISKGIRLPS